MSGNLSPSNNTTSVSNQAIGLNTTVRTGEREPVAQNALLNNLQRNKKEKLARKLQKTLAAIAEAPNGRTPPDENNAGENSELHIAAGAGDYTRVKTLLTREDIDVNAPNQDGKTALHLAAEAGHHKVIEILVQRADLDINAVISQEKSTPRGTASVSYLPRGAKLGTTALHLACDAEKNSEEVIAALLQHPNIEVNAVNLDPTCQIVYQLDKRGKEGLVKQQVKSLRATGVTLNGETALLIACRRGNSVTVRQLLQREDINANPKVIGPGRETALQIAEAAGNGEIVGLLLKHLNTNFNATNQHGETTLHIAVKAGNLEEVGLLLKHLNTNFNATNHKEEAALLIACENGNSQAVSKLLKHPDINVNATNHSGETALLIACENGNSQAVSKLLKHPDINVNTTNHSGETALHMAAKAWDPEVVGLLLEHLNTNVNATNQHGETALHIAAKFWNPAIVTLLLKQQDINVNATDQKGKTALHIAAKFWNPKIVTLLLKQQDINVNATDQKGETALHIASKAGNSEMVTLLQKPSDTHLTRADVTALSPPQEATNSSTSVCLLQQPPTKNPSELFRIYSRLSQSMNAVTTTDASSTGPNETQETSACSTVKASFLQYFERIVDYSALLCW